MESEYFFMYTKCISKYEKTTHRFTQCINDVQKDSAAI